MSIYETIEPETKQSYKCFGAIYDADGNAPDSDMLIACSTKELADATAKIMKATKENNAVEFEGKIYGEGPTPYVEGYEWACFFRVIEDVCTYKPARSIKEVLERHFSVMQKEWVEGEVIPLSDLI